MKQQPRLKFSIALKLISVVVLFELIIMLVFAKFEAIKQYPILEAFVDTLSLGILIIVAFYFLLSKPLKSILLAISTVQKGNLDVEVKLTSSDEMGYLAKAFNQMLQDLKRQRAQLVGKDYVESIINCMIDTLIVVDPKGIIKTVNPAILDLLGYKEEELIGQSAEKIFEGEIPFLRGEGLKKLTEQGFIKHYEFNCKAKSGTLIPVIFSGSVMYKDNKGSKEIIGIIGIVRDMRQLKELQEELIQSEKLASLGTLAAGIAHEIKNPLLIIIQGIEYLKSSASFEVSLFDAIERIKKATLRADKIVKDLLDFSRQTPPELEDFSIIQVIEETASLIEYQISSKNIKIVKELTSDLPKVKIDNNKMKQVFLNILLNAVQAMPRGGTISISLEKNEDQPDKNYLQVTVTDTGCGIPEENLPKVFDPFFSTKKGEGGTGLGLSVTRGIIEMHKGTISMESQAGKGTTVIINLPIV